MMNDRAFIKEYGEPLYKELMYKYGCINLSEIEPSKRTKEACIDMLSFRSDPSEEMAFVPEKLLTYDFYVDLVTAENHQIDYVPESISSDPTFYLSLCDHNPSIISRDRIFSHISKFDPKFAAYLFDAYRTEHLMNRDFKGELGESLYNELMYKYGYCSLNEIEPSERTKEMCIDMIVYRVDPAEELALIPEKISTRDFYLDLVAASYQMIRYIPEKYSSDPDFYISLLNKNPALIVNILKNFSPDSDLHLELIAREPLLINNLPQKFLSDPLFYKTLFNKKPALISKENFFSNLSKLDPKLAIDLFNIYRTQYVANHDFENELGEPLYNELMYKYGYCSLNEIEPSKRTREMCIDMIVYRVDAAEELTLVPKELLTRDFYLDLVAASYQLIHSIPEKFSSDLNFYKELFDRKPTLISGENFFSDLSKLDPKLAVDLFNVYRTEYLSKRDFVKELGQEKYNTLMHKFGCVSLHQVEPSKRTKELCMAMMTSRSDLSEELSLVPNNILTRDFYLDLVALSYKNISLIPKEFLSDRNFYIELLIPNSSFINFVPKEFLSDPDFYIELLTQGSFIQIADDLIKIVPKNMLLNHDFCLKLLEKTTYCYIYDIPKDFSTSPFFYLKAIEKNPMLAQEVPDDILMEINSKIYQYQYEKRHEFFTDMFKINPKAANILFNKYLAMYLEKQGSFDHQVQQEIKKMKKVGYYPLMPWRLGIEDVSIFKQFSKTAKKHMTTHQRVVSGTEEASKRLSPSAAILSKTYYGGKAGDLLKNKGLKQDLEFFTDYSKAPLMAPMLYILALAAKNQHKGSHSYAKPKKELKVIVYDDNSMKYLSKNVPVIEDAGGLYSHKSTIYSAHDRPQTIYHEATHMVVQEVMRNAARPYPANDNSLKTVFDQVVSQVQNNLTNIKNASLSDKEKVAYKAIEVIFSEYKKPQWDIELIVKVPEVLSILGYDDGYRWLKKNTPTLLEYYKNKFMPACMNYLAEQNAEQYLELDKGFVESMNQKSAGHRKTY